MAKAGKKSLDAKAYINAQVNEMRKKINKAPDEETRKQLVETFKETTASEKYQENLAVVQEDTDLIRKEARGRKWWDITSEEFKDAKTEFYGKNMSLDFWEDFEKLDLWKKVDYIFEKFGDTDYAADLIIDLLNPVKNWHTEFSHAEIYGLWNEETSYKNYMMQQLLNEKTSYDELSYWCDKIITKFWRGIISIRIMLFLADRFVWGSYRPKVYDKMKHDIWHWENLTQNTLKAFAKWSARAVVFMCIYLKDLVDDWAIKDYAILDAFIWAWFKINFKKVSPEWQKYFIDKAFQTKRVNVFGWDDKNNQVEIDPDINLWDGIDVKDYILNSFVKNIWNDYSIDRFCESGDLRLYVKYHKEIANILIEMWKIGIVKKHIKRFTWLTEEEKSEIMRK